MKVTSKQLWEYLAHNGASYNDFISYQSELPTDFERTLTQSQFDVMKKADILELVADQNMSENNLGGDDIVSVCVDVIDAICNGYTIATWYGENCEALVAGYRANELTVTAD